MGILIKPIVTEKMTAEGDKRNRYGFIVDYSANKIEIRKAVEAIFENVKVSDVKTMNCLGKRKRMRSARLGKRPDWKKALVTLTEGSIELL